MQFDTYTYAFFLPIVFILYWAVKRHRNVQNLILLAASYTFYGWWDWRMLGLIFFTSASTFASGLLIKPDRGQQSKCAAVANVVVNVGILCLFKYFNFFKDTLAATLHTVGIATDWPTLNVLLPVGISFYTFQAISYTIDVYRGDIKPTRDIPAFLVYVSFFPQLVAGPIERAKDLLPQFLRNKEFDYQNAVVGMRQILWGLAKKIVVANTMAQYVDYVFYHPSVMSPSTLLLGAMLFTVQIYADFSGYSDIAIGSARLFNIKLSTNFRYPLFSRSMREVWRNWHITLMQWFTSYVYIPLGGSRRSKLRTTLNVMVVFLLSGLWHGADWTFVIWGAFNGILVASHTFMRSRHEAWPPATRDLPRITVTFLLFSLTYICFRANNISHLEEIVSTLFTGNWLAAPMGLSALAYAIPMLAIEWIGRRQEFPLMAMKLPTACRWAIYWGLLALIAWKSIGQNTQFIYFQF